ncbi:hypothetical protein QOZ80_3BG0289650 [Eleusine coracana subsp. coracana]|nr:hypothetical protein QOZ80_3BG0289650 [Eleusine coracana subsp. coracana]
MGMVPNGLMPNASGGVTRRLDPERWAVAEGRTAELIARIQPNEHSEGQRQAVYHYVQRLVMSCLSCPVFTFGSVPLKTYLPDGDIDVTAFSHSEELKEIWANLVRDALEREEKNENAEFRVKEVQYIQAEVKIIKCLVENIVVDISYNQVGGLCTLCFLEQADKLINRNHLFKRSIILIKAWCFYESRILGAHHGLISTYALETLVLYIFHIFNNCFTGPLEVLFRFLEFFSNFDWEKFCLSLWGPVPISSLPDMTAEPPRMDNGELLLSKAFLDSCSNMYGVVPHAQESQGQSFVSKHFNVIDPLRTSNNLGRSVSKGNFFRIRSAFAFGAKSLGKLLECPKENLIAELNQFFANTWVRHGNGSRPDVPIPIPLDVGPMKGLRGRRTRVVDMEKPPMVDYSSRSNILVPEISGNHSTKSSQDESMSSMNSASHPSAKAPSDSNSVSSSYREDNAFVMNEELSSVSESSEMHYDEQVLVNLMASAKLHGLNGQGHTPWDGPGRPVAPNVNWGMVGPGQRVFPVMPVQPTTERPTGVLPHYGEDLPRYRAGTGTYLPNPKVSFRDRHTSSRNYRGGYSNDRSDHSDKEGSWTNSKHRNPNRSYGCSQSERSGMRPDRHATDDNQSDRQRRTYRNDSYRHESGAQYLVQGQSFGPTNSMRKPANVTHELMVMTCPVPLVKYRLMDFMGKSVVHIGVVPLIHLLINRLRRSLADS